MYTSGLALFWAVFIWSGIHPKDYPTWMMETLPTVIGMIAVFATRNHFRLTPLAYWLNFMTLCFCLALSAVYEMIEWWTAKTAPKLFSAPKAIPGTRDWTWPLP